MGPLVETRTARIREAVDADANANAAQAVLHDTDDYREGFRAFQEKRKPGFTGR